MIVVQRKQFRAQNEIEPAQEYLNLPKWKFIYFEGDSNVYIL